MTYQRNLEIEIENAARELAERYEEINLLYTISEILGRTVALEEASATILREVSETVGARRGAIMIREEDRDTLSLVASFGIDPSLIAQSVRLDDVTSIPAAVFRTRQPVVIDAAAEMGYDEFRAGPLLGVPIIWNNVRGDADLLGVILLTDRISNQPFSAGDIKLVVAVATQIGSAIQNARLVRESIEQQRLLREIQLAHDLQMKLLPNTNVVAPQAEVAARVVPAESVGGDFYHLLKLRDSATGVMIGDVSSHGYRAALIMALALSASAIHAQQNDDPGNMLHALLDSMGEELATTEMFITIFYGVVDRQKKTLVFANTGHPHAFLFKADGSYKRLVALDPPMGMTDIAPSSSSCEWDVGKDLLVLFTDGIPDSRNAEGKKLGEEAVLDMIAESRHLAPDQIVANIFDKLEQYIGDTPVLDDLTLLVLRS